MRRACTSLLVTTLLAISVGRAHAQVPVACSAVMPALPIRSPFAFVEVGNACVNLSPLIALNRVTGLFNLTLTDLIVGDGRIRNLNIVFDPDPSLNFTGSTSNLTSGPTGYLFGFGTAITPAFYSGATSTGSVTVTSGDQGSATVAQDGGNPFYTVRGSNGATSVPLGVDIGTGTCSSGAAPNTCAYPPPSGGPASSIFAPTFLDNLEVFVRYTETDANSQVKFTGEADVFVTSTPEPSTVALVLTGGLGLVGVGLVRRQRRL